MIFTQKELSPQLKEELKKYVYDVIGYLFKVYKELPCGFPEYIYQETLEIVLSENNVPHKKEFPFHPVFNGKTLSSFFKLDFMLERDHGNIIIECKAIEKLGEKERHQLFSYLVGTQFPVGILVNFSTYPRAEIEKYYYDEKDGTITPF
jgi:GxxExxY protein